MNRVFAVALDGSPAANAAFEYALALVRPDGEVSLLHAINTAAIVAECTTPYGGDPTIALDALHADERELFVSAVARAAARGIRATTHSLDGRPSDVISGFLEHAPVDAVALGTRGLHGLARAVLGSTADTVLRHSPVPVLVTSEACAARPQAGFRRILVALDGSPPSEDAAAYAIDLASALHAAITFVHADEPDATRNADARWLLSKASAAAAAAGVAFDGVTLHGDAEHAVPVAAEAIHADLAVIGTHARTGLDRLRSGSVAEAVIRSMRVPVFAIPSRSARGRRHDRAFAPSAQE